MGRDKLKLAPVVLAGLLAIQPAFAQSKKVTIASYGGSYGDLLDDVCIKPFAAQSGFAGEKAVTDNVLTQLRIQQSTGNVVWDVTPAAEGDAYPTALANNWVERIDWTQIDPDNKLPAAAKKEFGFAGGGYSSVLGVRTDKVPAGKSFKSWADFWNVKDFPGPRSLRNSPVENLEFAMMADGVPPAEVYNALRAPGGIDRAFAKFDQIKPHVTHWWTSAQQPVQGLATGELFYATSYNGRITKLKTDKLPVQAMWNGGSLNVAPILIPKNAPNVKGAHAYLKFCYLDSGRTLQLARLGGVGSLLPEMFAQLTPDEQEDFPTNPKNVATQVLFDAAFWYEKRKEIQARWEAYMLSK